MIKRLILFAMLAIGAAALSLPAEACGTGHCSSTGGQSVPAPSSVALFALAATLLLTRRRRA